MQWKASVEKCHDFIFKMSLMSHDCISCPWALLDIVVKFILNSPLKKKQLKLIWVDFKGYLHPKGWVKKSPCLCVYNPDPFHSFHYFCLLAIFFAFKNYLSVIFLALSWRVWLYYCYLRNFVCCQKSKLLSFVFIFPQLSVCLVTLFLLIFDTVETSFQL